MYILLKNNSELDLRYYVYEYTVTLSGKSEMFVNVFNCDNIDFYYQKDFTMSQYTRYYKNFRLKNFRGSDLLVNLEDDKIVLRDGRNRIIEDEYFTEYINPPF